MDKPKRRKFHARDYAAIIERQHGLCACGCGEPLGDDPRNIAFDHRTPLWMGGADTIENLDALIVRHHVTKTSGEAAALAKTRRIIAKDGHRRRNPNETEKQLKKLLQESSPSPSSPESQQ